MRINPVSRNLICFLSILLLFGFIFTNGETPSRGNFQFNQSEAFSVYEQTAGDAPYYTYLPIIQNGPPLLASAKFVSPQGNDSNPGTLLQPWKTIRKAANSVVAGSVVYIRGGEYREYVSINRSGTQSQPIRFLAYPGEAPVIDGTNIDTNSDGLLTLDGDWIEISGLEVRYSTYVGISSYGSHNTLTNVYVHHSSRSGIYISGDYGIVQDSRIWRNSIRNENGATSGGSSGIVSSNDEFGNGITDYSVIRRNRVWENWGQGINVHHSKNTSVEDNLVYDSYGANIYIHDTTNVVCQRNFVYMNSGNNYMGNYGSKVGLMMGQEWQNPIINVKDVLVLNNIFYGSHRNLFWYEGDISGAGMTNVLIAYNTFVNGSGGTGGGNANIILNRGVNSNVRFVNNIVQQDDQLPVISTVNQPGVTYSYNLWSKTPDSDASGSGDIIADPKLSKSGQPYSVDWYRLTAVSPAINKATILTEVNTDFFGNPRGSTPDMGAIEFTP